jgi:uncharacterized protein YkwD
MSDFDKTSSALGPKRHRAAVKELVNAERRAHNLNALRFAPSLLVSARAWAKAMSRSSKFGHGSGSNAFLVRAARFPFVLNTHRPGIAHVGENLAVADGTGTTPREIVRLWMNSPSHRAAILGQWQYTAVWSELDDVEKTGIQKRAVTVVQHFARRS